MVSRLRLWIAGWFLLVFAAVGTLGAGRPQQSAGAPEPAVSPQRAVINQYCVGCHNDKLKTAEIALNTLNVDNAGENPEVWEKVVRKLRGRMMPPPGRPRADESTYDSVVSYLEKSLARAA